MSPVVDHSIFQEYYAARPFVDRFDGFEGEPVTVIIPTVHTNELWEANLKSIYREIPVAKLLLGDGGCMDDTIEIASKFPRLEVHDHREYKSLGFSIRKLIEATETEWFIYLHSDVYLPEGWFDEMNSHKGEYDWFGCRMQHTVMVEYDNDYGERPYAGSQMGRRSSFVEGIKRIDDDYVYRQEDFVFSDIVARAGGREGRLDNLFHYHQTIKKPSKFWNPSNVKVTIEQSLSREQEIRVWETQVKGIVKYLKPTMAWPIRDAGRGGHRMIEIGHWTPEEIYTWIRNEDADWLPFVRRRVFLLRMQARLNAVGAWVKNMLRRLVK